MSLLRARYHSLKQHPSRLSQRIRERERERGRMNGNEKQGRKTSLVSHCSRNYSLVTLKGIRTDFHTLTNIHIFSGDYMQPFQQKTNKQTDKPTKELTNF